MIQLMNSAYIWAQQKFGSFVKNEKGEVNVVAIVVLIGIAVLLALFFKEQIGGLLKDLFDTIRGGATGGVSDPIT